jgi:putative membrane protein
MGNIFKILRRDLSRLFKAPAALAVVLVLLFLPSAYSWCNIAGFWDPYGNTSKLEVCVVNQDTGGRTDLTGDIDVGAQIVDALKENSKLDWQFCNYDEAMDRLYSGDVYAVYVIPDNFTEDLLTLVSGELKQPDIQYFVNEKLAPVGAKITDSGASTLDETINSAFVATVADVVVETLDDSITSANDKLTTAKSQTLIKLEEAKTQITELRSSLQSLNEGTNDKVEKIQNTQSSLQAISDDLDSTSQHLQTLASRGADLQSEIAEIASKLNGTMVDFDSLAQATQGADSIESAANKATEAIQTQKSLTTQSCELLDQAINILDISTSATSSATNVLDGIDSQLESLIVDTKALNTSGISNLLEQDDNNDDAILDAQKISDFMAAPTTIVTEKLYHVNSYGSAMAPLFMNLTFWVGAFMLLVVMKQEVDGEGIDHITAKQRYVGRFLFFAILSLLQAIICCSGVKAIGVEVVNTPALFFSAAVASITYLAIIYALSTTLQHIGKGICLVLVFAQIPGATGLYPVEMTSPFFQTVYPLLPFTYGIGAMRESICGFYGTQFQQDILILAVFAIVFFFAGLFLKPAMANVNKVIGDQIQECDILNGEQSETPARPYRLSQIVRALTSRTAYRNAILRRHERFERIYPRLRRISIIVGIIMPAILGVLLAVTPTERVVLITICFIWMIVYFVFLTIVESLRASLSRQLRLDAMNDDELKKLYNLEKGGHNA